MDYRIWAIMGIVLLVAELMTPSFFLVFFGIQRLRVKRPRRLRVREGIGLAA
jgi:membrane protein implicated in regulation of membrane protease activity